MLTRPSRTSRSVIFFAGQDWWYHNRAHSDMQLALQLAGERRVLLVNSIGTRMPIPGRTSDVRGRLTRKLRSILRGVRQPVPELPGFFVYSPVSIPLYQYAWGRRMNQLLLVTQLRLVARWLRLRRPDIVVTPPTAWDVARRLPRRSLTFNRSDKHSAWSEVDQRQVLERELALLRQSDLVLYVSSALMAEDAPEVGSRAFFLDHGVDLDRFNPEGPIAPELAAIPRPRLGFFGNMRAVAVDEQLLLQVADGIPEASIVLVGPSNMPMAELIERPNVYWFDQQPHEAIPAFGRGFDVALMPWHDNEWIRNCNPVKLKEYLALGLRTVTIDFPEVRRYRDLVDIAADREEFVALCRQAMHQAGDEAGRRAAVAGDSWAGRGAALREAIDRLNG
jgi:hypothetical protein